MKQVAKITIQTHVDTGKALAGTDTHTKMQTQACVFIQSIRSHTQKNIHVRTHTHVRCKQMSRYQNHAFVKQKETVC